MRVLITNVTLASRTGTELFVRDLALGLRGAGVDVSVFSPEPAGGVGPELERHGIAVTGSLDDLAEPDLIHGHHSLPTLAALLRFRRARGLFVVHDRLQWTDEPPLHPRLLRHVAVDFNCLERLAGVPVGQRRVIHNAVDLDRFRPRGPLPERPRRALLFGNTATRPEVVAAVEAACAAEGIALELAGAGAGLAAERPEDLLPEHDLVFAKARCALEALAVGCAVVLCDQRGVGGLVTPERLDEMRRLNFGMRLLIDPVEPAVLRRAIAGYQPLAAAEVSRWVRREASLAGQVREFLDLYRELLALPLSDDSEAEARAEARLVAGLLPAWNASHEAGQRAQAGQQAMRHLTELVAARETEIASFGRELAAQRELVAARDTEIAAYRRELRSWQELVAARDQEIAKLL